MRSEAEVRQRLSELELSAIACRKKAWAGEITEDDPNYDLGELLKLCDILRWVLEG